MTGLDTIKNNLIDQIIATKNKQLLTAISNIFNSTQKEDTINLSSSQIEMLYLNEKDIEDGNLVSSETLSKQD